MDETILKIEKVVFGGNGLAREDKRVIFVPFTLPGETVRAIIRRKHKDYLEADATEIVEPSPDRVPPDCGYFGRCGGCRLSHARYETQLRIKHDILKETLQRNHLDFPAIDVVAGPAFGYRHRARLKYSARAGAVGFHEWNSHHIADIKQCLCLTPALNALLHRLRTELAAKPADAVSEIECYENDRHETAVYFDAEIPVALKEALQTVTQVYTPEDFAESAFRVRFRDVEFPMRPDIFLQVNPALWNPMMQEVESHFDSSDVVVELYGGAGFFTIPLAKRVTKIFGCEENPAAVLHARELSPENVTWVCRKAEDFVYPPGATSILVDPPRAGLHRNVVDHILKHPFRQITYVSCDAPSLARDLRLLSSRYSIERLVLFDLFAQTYHFETIARLVPVHT